MKKVYMRYPGFKTKALTLSYDDGVEQDIKFIDIINKAGLKCTFNLNSGQFYDEPQNFAPGRIHRVLTKQAAIELYKSSGHEVAVHTLNHPFPNHISPIAMTAQVYEDRKNLEQMFGVEVRGMAYPYGHYNDTLIEIVKNCGIVYSRTTEHTYKFDIPTDWLRMPATCHHKSPELMDLTDKFLKKKVTECPLLFYLWGHTFEFEEKDNWYIIEQFCDKIGHNDEIWYATNIEVHDYVEAFRALRFTANGEYIFNPTCIPVYIFVREVNKEYLIEPGQRIKL